MDNALLTKSLGLENLPSNFLKLWSLFSIQWSSVVVVVMSNVCVGGGEGGVGARGEGRWYEGGRIFMRWEGGGVVRW